MANELNQPDYFVVMIDYGKAGREAVVDLNMLWSDALGLVHEAASDGHTICFVHHIHDGGIENRTQEALDATLNFLADHGEPLTYSQRDFIEHHFGLETANAFRQEAA